MKTEKTEKQPAQESGEGQGGAAASELAVIYEDNHLVVVIKPPNVPTQADESGDLDMLTKVKQYIKVVADKPGAVYCGLVHRLDRVTGGVMVFARTTKAAARLSEQLQNGGFEKRYLAVVQGEPKLREGKLVDHLLKNEKRNVVEVVPSATTGAKRAELEYKTLHTISLGSKGSATLVEIRLITGRSHQARVQMANLGHPLFGDAKYSDGFGRGHNLALWAYSLTFSHPTTKEQMKFVVNPPATTPWVRFPIQWSKSSDAAKRDGGS